MWFLKHSLLDIQVLSMRKFELYDTLDSRSTQSKNNLILDVITIENLNLLGGIGSLQHKIDMCKTQFGKR